jgi:hypothetical protein
VPRRWTHGGAELGPALGNPGRLSMGGALSQVFTCAQELSAHGLSCQAGGFPSTGNVS